jgi:hypothetical protein
MSNIRFVSPFVSTYAAQEGIFYSKKFIIFVTLFQMIQRCIFSPLQVTNKKNSPHGYVTNVRIMGVSERILASC